MIRLIKSSFAWQFAAGFLIGAAGMVAMHTAQPDTPSNPYAATRVVR